MSMRTTARIATAGLTVWIGFGVMVSPAQDRSQWLAHDMQRPRPPVVRPGRLSLPVEPPADAVVLFDGTDMSQWRNLEGAPAGWRVNGGAMEAVPDSGYVRTAAVFGDVQLHLEWAAPTPASGSGQKRGNSGVFLMGLYEVQVLDSYDNDTYADGQAAAIYGQYPPLVNACLPPGEWQSYDIIFRRPRFASDGSVTRPAQMTVIHNGILVQDKSELLGPTAWLNYKPYTQHDDRLPIALQDHGNPVRYRNIWLRELDETLPPRGLAEQTVAPANVSREQLARLAGSYAGPFGDFGSIGLADDRLQLHLKTGQVIDLVPVSDHEFVMRCTAGRLVFDVREGPASGFTVELGGDRQTITRQTPAE